MVDGCVVHMLEMFDNSKEDQKTAKTLPKTNVFAILATTMKKFNKKKSADSQFTMKIVTLVGVLFHHTKPYAFVSHLSTSNIEFKKTIWKNTGDNSTFQGPGLGTFLLRFVQFVSKFIEKQHLGITPRPSFARNPVIYLQVNVKQTTYGFYTILCFRDMRLRDSNAAIEFLPHIWHDDMGKNLMKLDLQMMTII